MNDLCDLTIEDTSRIIRSRRASCAEVLDSCLRRIERDEPALNAFISVMAGSAFEEAAKADRRLARGSIDGPLHGIPISLKDLYDVAGLKTTVGSKIFADNVATRDSAVAERLRAAGAVISGKANMTEFALGGVQPEYGPAVNPWDHTRTAGGSSSGSGVAVASGMVYASIGSDTGGSIRIPASFCGVVGFKPTYGRVSRRGMMPLAWSLDHAGPLTRTVYDAALVLQDIIGHDPADPTTNAARPPTLTERLRPRLDGVRIGIPENYFFGELDPEVGQAIDAARRALDHLGANFKKVEIPHAEAAGAALMTTMLCEGAAAHRKALTTRPHDFSQPVRSMFEQGSITPAVTYIQAQQMRTLLIQEYLEALSEVDVLLYPTTPMPAFHPDEPPLSPDGVSSVGRCTVSLPLTGLPGVSVPCGFTRSGLPIGMQLVARHFDEAALVRIGHAYQNATDWHTRRPPAAGDRKFGK